MPKAQQIDLESASEAGLEAQADVCIVGAGAAGCYLAQRLAAGGLNVAVMEAGSLKGGSGTSLGMDPLFSADYYAAAFEGRAFGWGGSTSRWGGVLVPYGEDDRRPGPWSAIVDRVQAKSARVWSVLGLGSEPSFEGSPLLGPELRLWHSEFLPFGRRNLAYLLEEGPALKGQVTVYLNAVVTLWNWGTGGEAAQVAARSKHGKRLSVSSKSFVLAAGTIETTRMLLEIERSTQGKLLPRGTALGQGLSDHLSCPIAEVEAAHVPEVIRLFGPRFRQGRLRGSRFIERGLTESEPRYFAHLLFLNENPGFQVARKILAAWQARKLPALGLGESLKGLAGLFLLAYHKFFKAALYIPPSTPVRLQLDIEQSALASNAITLSEQRDAFGRPVASIHWAISREDQDAIQTVAARLLGKAGSLPGLKPLPLDGSGPKPYDAYHPVGCCRMGDDSKAVLDLGLKVRGTQNLYALCTGIFPSAGTANPTFSLLCMGEALAEDLIRKART